ncbi:hypothetical protein HanLR1_Chr10g0362901 [Helianthus annuus]|nr:hypothetical protein HanHA89_Chr10g0385361 [Helianthus annuus]KAJ0696924.1 hypothetical protein HanLR1_Chr10g0362901 [Helianthus annuus]
MNDKHDKHELVSTDTTVHKPLHPVYTVSNIQNKVRTLDGTKVSYALWVKLFTLHAKGYHVLCHIDGTPSPAKESADFAEWENVDSIVLQWIYGTLSDDLLVRVMADESTALDAWKRVKRLFVSNKGPRSQAIQHELANLTLASMTSLDEYCQKVRDLTDQLHALDFPMNDQQRVLHLVKGLPSEFDTIASILNNSLPSWEDAIDQLLSEAGRLKTRDAVAKHPAIAAAIPSSHPPPNPNTTHPSPHHTDSPNPPTTQRNNRPYNHRSNSRPNRSNHNNSRGPPNYSSNNNTHGPNPYPKQNPPPPFYPPYWAPPYWTPPPCPYPTQGWAQPWHPQASSQPSNNRGNRRSAQANLVEVDPLEPTQLADAVHALSVDSGDSNDQWNFDTGFQGWHDPESSQQF